MDLFHVTATVEISSQMCRLLMHITCILRLRCSVLVMYLLCFFFHVSFCIGLAY